MQTVGAKNPTQQVGSVVYRTYIYIFVYFFLHYQLMYDYTRTCHGATLAGRPRVGRGRSAVIFSCSGPRLGPSH